MFNCHNVFNKKYILWLESSGTIKEWHFNMEDKYRFCKRKVRGTFKKESYALGCKRNVRALDTLDIFISIMPISSPNPMFDHLLESSDDSNKWSNLGFG